MVYKVWGKFAVTPGAITCIPALLVSWENWNCYPPHQDAVFTWKASEIPRGRGSKRRKFPRGGVRFSRSFFQDFETRIIIDDLTLTLLAAECFLTAYKILAVYM